MNAQTPLSTPTEAFVPLPVLAPVRRRLSRTAVPVVHFRPFTLETAEVAGRWLAEESNHKWLDFGGGRQVISGRTLFYMAQSRDNFIRSMHDGEGRQIGVIGLQHVSSPFRNAMLWGVRPRLRPPALTHAWVEIKEFLRIAFAELDLHSVYAWVAEPNRLSLAALERVGMRPMGRQRAAHVIDGAWCDRILLDLMVSEFDPFDPARHAQ